MNPDCLRDENCSVTKRGYIVIIEFSKEFNIYCTKQYQAFYKETMMLKIPWKNER